MANVVNYSVKINNSVEYFPTKSQAVRKALSKAWTSKKYGIPTQERSSIEVRRCYDNGTSCPIKWDYQANHEW